MSVYYKEKTEYFITAVESMLAQTVKPAQFVVVCDGQLGDSLDGAVKGYEEKYPELFCVVRLPENGGLAGALDVGLRYCECEYVARMDSDDIALPDRMERQLKAMKDSGADICSGTVEEFEENPEVVTARKTLPESHKEIIRYARRRNPFNHPCAVYKKSAVEAVGGYEKYPLFEDYHLWVKMLRNGAVGVNLSETLLKMRSGNGMYARRGGYDYFVKAARLERYKRSVGFTSLCDYTVCMVTKLIFSLVPNSLREFMYKRLLRKR
jgi:glycosyltransferase involved in cell wall biosynthesis